MNLSASSPANPRGILGGTRLLAVPPSRSSNLHLVELFLKSPPLDVLPETFKGIVVRVGLNVGKSVGRCQVEEPDLESGSSEVERRL